jgi:hypothetical protein
LIKERYDWGVATVSEWQWAPGRARVVISVCVTKCSAGPVWRPGGRSGRLRDPPPCPNTTSRDSAPTGSQGSPYQGALCRGAYSIQFDPGTIGSRYSAEDSFFLLCVRVRGGTKGAKTLPLCMPCSRVVYSPGPFLLTPFALPPELLPPLFTNKPPSFLPPVLTVYCRLLLSDPPLTKCQCSLVFLWNVYWIFTNQVFKLWTTYQSILFLCIHNERMHQLHTLKFTIACLECR